MSARLALSSLVVVVAAAATVLWFRPNEEAPTPVSAQPAPPTQVTPPPAAPVMTYEAPKAVREPKAEDRAHLLKLPNGEYVPSLNGVLNPPAMQWPAHIPYSPIVGRERDTKGNDWYVHADGSKSTNAMIFRSDLGRMDATTQVANPEAALPMEPGDIERVKQQTSGPGAGTPGGGAPIKK